MPVAERTTVVSCDLLPAACLTARTSHLTADLASAVADLETDDVCST